MAVPPAVESAYKAAMDCSVCFGASSSLHLPTIDLPQPRWVGPGYWDSKPRVLVVMLNPGQGDGPQLEQNLRFRSLLHQYKCGKVGFTNVLEFQREHMRVWGRPQGRFLPFYTTSLGLDIDSLSFINIALCATQKNQYPQPMLNHCFETHTASIACKLQPHVVLLSGAATHSFAANFLQRLPATKVVPMLHYAHRKGRKVEADQLAHIRDFLAEAGRAKRA